MTELLPILLVGAGGHAKACIDVIEQTGHYHIVGLVGMPDQVGDRVLGYPVMGTDSDLKILRAEYKYALVTTGQIKSAGTRIRLHDLLQKYKYTLPSIISPHAYVSPHASVGAATIVMHGAIINAGVIVGRNCILNSRSLVEHDAVIADHCHISTAAIVNGGAFIGSGCFIGSGSIVREGIKIGERCVLGMGQTALADCEPNTQLPSKKVAT